MEIDNAAGLEKSQLVQKVSQLYFVICKALTPSMSLSNVETPASVVLFLKATSQYVCEENIPQATSMHTLQFKNSACFKILLIKPNN